MYLEELTPHALYMRLKRLCETTKAGNLQVSEEVHQQWLTGNCDELGLALVLALKKFGYGDSKKVRDAVRGEFAAQMHRVKEVSRQKEEQLEGGWYTTDRMKTEPELQLWSDYQDRGLLQPFQECLGTTLQVRHFHL